MGREIERLQERHALTGRIISELGVSQAGGGGGGGAGGLSPATGSGAESAMIPPSTLPITVLTVTGDTVKASAPPLAPPISTEVNKTAGEKEDLGAHSSISDAVKDMVAPASPTADVADRVPEPWFEVLVSDKPAPRIPSTGGQGQEEEDVGLEPCVTVLRKGWSEFERLHHLLVTDEFGCNPEVKKLLPALPALSGQDAHAASQLAAYLKALAAVPQVANSHLFGGFLDQMSTPARVQANLPRTAIDFLLQPFKREQVYVPRRSEHTQEIPVLKGEAVVWQFYIQDTFNLEFSATFQPCNVQPEPDLFMEDHHDELDFETDGSNSDGIRVAVAVPTNVHNLGHVQGFQPPMLVHCPTRQLLTRSCSFSAASTTCLQSRYATVTGEPVQGSYTCPSAGRMTLRWNNQYSRFRGKQLSFIAESVTPHAMKAATEASEAAAQKLKAGTQDAGPHQVIGGDLAEAVIEVQVPSDESSATGMRGEGSLAHEPSRRRRFSVGKAANMLYSYAVNHGLPPFKAGGGADASGGDAAAIGEFVRKFEELEDELAEMSARRAQTVAQTKILLARLQRSDTVAERLELSLEETRVLLRDERASNEQLVVENKCALESVAEKDALLGKLQAELLRAKRERDLLQAERNVWQVARGGIQSELAKVVAELGQEKQAHEDSQATLEKTREDLRQLRIESRTMSKKLSMRGNDNVVEKAKEDARVAMEEAQDSRTALAEMEGELAKLNAERRVLALELKQHKRAGIDSISAATAEAEEARMMQRTMEARLKKLEDERMQQTSALAGYEVKVNRLKAEKKVLLAELRRRGAKEQDGDGPERPEKGKEGSAAVVVQPTEKKVVGRDSLEDNTGMIKQMSRQLVHLREQQQELEEQLESEGGKIESTVRLHGDVMRAISHLSDRIRVLMEAAG